MPSPHNLRQLGEQHHQQLLARARLTVTSEIAEVFIPVLVKSLRKQFWNLSDQDLIDSAVEDALVDYFARPAQFDPTKAGLFTYLRVRAKSYLLNILAQQKDHQDREKVVEVAGAESVYKVETQESADVEATLIERDVDNQTMQQLREILSDPLDLEMVKLMMEGVRETELYAALLGISAQSLEAQKIIVKRHKDRLKKTIQRKYKREDKGR